MAEHSHPDSLALQAYELLRQDETSRAVAVIDDALTVLGEARPHLRARLWSWRAQALLGQRNPTAAITAIRQGLRIARQAQDSDGLQALRTLQQQAMGMAAALNVTPPAEDDSPLALAMRAIDDGNMKMGEILALGALAHARKEGDARDVVFACLALARIEHRQDAALNDARRHADASGDKNLITAVVRAFRAAGQEIPAKVF